MMLFACRGGIRWHGLWCLCFAQQRVCRRAPHNTIFLPLIRYLSSFSVSRVNREMGVDVADSMHVGGYSD